MTNKIGIIGAGISGLTLGCILAKDSKNCTIYEKSDGPSNHGAGISLSPNIIRLLDELEILEKVEKESCLPIDIVWRDNVGKVIREVNVSEFGKLITTNRKILIKHLLDKYLSLGGKIEFSHELVEIKNEKELLFQNGNEDRVDFIAGCDGIKSFVRSNYIKNDSPKFTGYTAWRGIGTSDSKRINIYLGPRSHIVCYPINNSLETSFIGVIKNNYKNNESWREEGTHDQLITDLSDYGDFIHSLFKSSEKVFRWGLYDRDKLNNFSKGNITLLGDSAHPMMPFLGQGGAMAFEDAFVLGKLLLKLPSYDLAQEKYNDLRRKRVNYIKSSSALQGYVNHLSNPLLKNVRNYLLKNTNIAMRRTKNIYNYDTLEKLI